MKFKYSKDIWLGLDHYKWRYTTQRRIRAYYAEHNFTPDYFCSLGIPGGERIHRNKFYWVEAKKFWKTDPIKGIEYFIYSDEYPNVEKYD